MSRLIDADKLIEWINEQREQVTKKQVSGTDGSIFTREALVTMQRCISTFENKINNQPTAFDTEKVVEQLEEVNMNYFLTIANTGSEKLDIAYGYASDSINKAVDIVKKGGVE